MINIIDIAYYILNSIGGKITTMKLQKLCYYSYVWGLVWSCNKPLFKATFRAWDNGPVSKELFDIHKGLFVISKDDIPTNKLSTKHLPDNVINIVNTVLEYYGDKTGDYLSALSHLEKPWIETRKNKNSDIITNKTIYDYYSNIKIIR